MPDLKIEFTYPFPGSAAETGFFVPGLGDLRIKVIEQEVTQTPFPQPLEAW